MSLAIRSKTSLNAPTAGRRRELGMSFSAPSFVDLARRPSFTEATLRQLAGPSSFDIDQCMQRAVVEKSWQRWLRQLLSSGEKEERAMAQEIMRPDMGAVASRYRDPFAEMRAEMDRVFAVFSGPVSLAGQVYPR